jgi:hypothetical protein
MREFSMTKPNNERREAHLPVRELSATEPDAVSGGTTPLAATVVTNLANMRHETLKAVVQNLRV